MKQIQAVESLTLSLIDDWNDSNPVERLNPELIKLIDYYLLLAYVAGTDGLGDYLLKILDKASANHHMITIKYLNDMIKLYEP